MKADQQFIDAARARGLIASEGRSAADSLNAVAENLERINEKEFMAAVTKLAKENGFLVYHTRNSRKSEPGFPDLVFAKRRRLLFAELKVGSNKLAAEQELWIETLRAAGQEAFVWRPADWPDIHRELSRPA